MAETPPGASSSETPPEFATLAAKMPGAVRRLLVDNADPSTVSVLQLLAELSIKPERHLLTAAGAARVVRAPCALSNAACENLRLAVDRQRNATKADSVDGAPEHQLPLSLIQLEELVGKDAVQSLCKLAREFVKADEHPADIFVRRYSGGTRPWNPFHHDSAAVTVNVALGADATIGGGRLVAVVGDTVATINREEGEATVHDSRLLHAVTRITSGVRYSLILFYGQAEVAAETPEEAAAFSDYINQLSADRREELLASIARRVDPVAQRLKAEEAAFEAARAQAPKAKQAVEDARAEEAAAAQAVALANLRLQDAQAAVRAALQNAQAKRDECFGVQVCVQRLRVELAATRAEAKRDALVGRGGDAVNASASSEPLAPDTVDLE